MPTAALRYFIVLSLALLGCARAAMADERREIDLSGAGWHLWYDQQARWRDDELFAPPVDLAKVPTNPPTGGWEILDRANSLDVSVPGTVEEYLQKGNGPDGDIQGVSWWWRSVTLPPAASPKRVLLRFESARQRAEVYVNHKLVGYDVVGNSPFEVDLSDAVKPGETFQLAVRITDPGGNFDWRDYTLMPWGRYQLPMSHGFGGITGHVKLIQCDPVYVDDIYVQNRPDPETVFIHVTLNNTTAQAVKKNFRVSIADAARPNFEIAGAQYRDQQVPPGESNRLVKFKLDSAKLWDLDHPTLYQAQASFGLDHQLDPAVQTFGFRSFALDGIGKDAVFRLNGKRIVLRTAISWGFWPINGIFPTPELAEKQVRVARELGLNMLNFHRAIGNPTVLDKADELGLLYFEEPGGYTAAIRDPFARALAREKLLRMVKRDRSHPSLIIYNMINEQWDQNGAMNDPALLAIRQKDMRDAHALDPSRVITHTSAWAQENVDGLAKMHMRPFDSKIYMSGWYDFHRATGPETWQQGFYHNPTDFYGYTKDTGEIVYFGEEGAISSPPRLQLIQQTLKQSSRLGWDGQVYLDWYRAFDQFLDHKNLRDAFPTVDAFTTALATVAYNHQGRKIENIRIANVPDGYAINGWESELIENHSGIVDIFRNPKADPAILAYYNQPLYIAVKPRAEFAGLPGHVLVDFFIINEKNLNGRFRLNITEIDPAGHRAEVATLPVSVRGGDVYGELLAEAVEVPIISGAGLHRIDARLLEGGRELAAGHEQVLAVDWQHAQIDGPGAVIEATDTVSSFLKNQKQFDAAQYAENLPKLDWIIAAASPLGDDPLEIPPTAVQPPGWATTFLKSDSDDVLARRTDKTLDYFVDNGASPDPSLPILDRYRVRFTGKLTPDRTGSYGFVVDSSEGVRLIVNNQKLIDTIGTTTSQSNRGMIDLHAAQPVSVSLELLHTHGGARVKLRWIPPATHLVDPNRLLQRVRDDGTTLIILNRADTWMEVLHEKLGVGYNGSFPIGKNWLGGIHFVRQHPLFKDLPVNCAMDWPYQAVVQNGDSRMGLMLDGEELVAGCWHSYPMHLGTAVGVIRCGKGRVIVSTLDITDNLLSSDDAANVARKIFCNFLEYAQRQSE